MYYYIIDPQKINQKEFERVQNQLYSCLSSLRISGEISRVTSLRSVPQLVNDAIVRQANTIIAVGYDTTVQEIINTVGEKEIVIGYVPLVETELSKVLGISGVENACQTIAHRRIEVLDLGQIQNHYFFTKVGIGQNIDNLSPKSMFDFSKFSGAANLKPIPVSMEIDGQFKAQFEVAIGAIFNSRSERGEKGIANPTDGLLDVLLLPGITALDAWKYRNELASGSLERVPGCAVMHGKRIVFQSPDGLPFFVGDKTVAKIPAVAEALTRKIKMIVGKERTF